MTVEEPSPPPTALSSLIGTTTGKTTRKPVGTVRFTPSIGKVSRLVVLKEYRQYGFGRELMQEVARYAARLKKDDVREAIVGVGEEERIRLKLHSQASPSHALVKQYISIATLTTCQIQVIPFYQSLGYRPEGERFDEDGGKARLAIALADRIAPHQKMVQDIRLSAEHK